MKSLQRVLAVRFAATMLAALVAIAVWAYVGVRRTLRQELDRSLRTTAALQLDVLRANAGTLAVHRNDTDPASFVTEVNRLVALRDTAGRIVAANTPAARALPFDTVAFLRARAGGEALADGPWFGSRVRTIYQPLPAGFSSGAVVLQTAASLDPLHRESRAVLIRMLVTALLGTVVTSIGAAWLAASSLRPVREIAAQAAAITGRGAGERITAHADVAEFEGLIGVLNDMLTRLERAVGWHQRVIRDLGHDLRTPITAMRAGVEVALWAPRNPDEYRRVLASTMEEIERLTLISDALISMGRLASGRLVLHRTALDARALAADAVRRAQQRIGGHRVTLAVNGRPTVSASPTPTPPTPLALEGDPRLLGMVLDQLLDNGLRHTPADTAVRMSVKTLDGTVGYEAVEFVVEDQGPGVPDELLPHLFEPFYRADTARGRESGPGLGLTLAAAVVDLHHGTIQAERGEGGGLRVRVHVPRGAIESPGDEHAGGERERRR